uniref:PARP-type domain-containing protein n=1 Tax=Panagrolaimus davidi TaxID=227884 RepID=A0A914PKN1_9BILA
MYNDRVQCVCFQYALSDRSKCEGCEEYIPFDALRVKCEFGNKFYHFDCFWKKETTAKCKKDEIMVAVQGIQPQQYQNGHWNVPFIGYFLHKNTQHLKNFFDRPFVSLEVLDKNMDDIVPLIRTEDIERIRQHAALAQEGKTSFYIPKVVEGTSFLFRSCEYCFSFEKERKECLLRQKAVETPEEKLRLEYDKTCFHPKCLSESGFVNIDAKEIGGYASLDENCKKFLDGLFKKKDQADPIFMADNTLSLEHCSSKYCVNMSLAQWARNAELPAEKYNYNYERNIPHKNLRIRYEHLSYHPQCFSELRKVNVDGKDIPNYDKMRESDKLVLDSWFTKSIDFDIPVVEKSKKDDYCDATSCSISPTPSKFPYPYSIKNDEIQIRYKGGIYHPICLQASGNISVNPKDIKNYESLSDGEKETLDGIFKKSEKRKLEEDESNVASEVNGEISAKKMKLFEEEESGETKKD